MKSRASLAFALILGMSLVGLSVAWAASGESNADADKLQTELRALRDERVVTAAMLVESSQQAFSSGTIVLSDLLLAYQQLTDARLAIAPDHAARLKALEDAVLKARTVEGKIEALFRTGSRGGEANAYAMAKSARQTAEIAVLEEKLRGLETP